MKLNKILFTSLFLIVNSLPLLTHAENISSLTKLLQKYFGLEQDSILGPITQAKIKQFQDAMGLEQTGKADQNLLNKIQNFGQSGTPDQQPKLTTQQPEATPEQKAQDVLKSTERNKSSNEKSASGGSGKGDLIAIGRATFFGHNRDCTHDKSDNGITACKARNTRCGVHEKTGKPRDPKLCEMVSLPFSTLKKAYGSSKCSSFQGKKIKVTNLANNMSAVYEIWEKGPTEAIKAKGTIIDMTGCAMEKIDPGGKGNIRVRIESITSVGS